jgi:adenylate cyclase
MGVDEEGTLAQLKAHRRTLVDPKISEHRGRIVKTTGDGMLVEFASVVDALRCAVEIQRGMVERNTGVPHDERIEFRVGINLGDIIVDGGDIFGDGVNIAARLEVLAEPGGICISQTVLNHARDKFQIDVEDVGARQMKNIARPVHVYRVRLEPSAVVNEPAPVLDRPSVAVLPFNNMSGDPSQEFFADGIAEDVTTLLSRLPGFFVIARNSTFTYKGRAVDTRQVARELGVRYVLEGSVQKAGKRVRVTTQLIEGNSGKHIWADKYDREIEDLFVVQDEITQGFYAALKTNLLLAEAEFAQRKPPQSIDAWGYTVRAFVKWYYVTPENFIEVEALARHAIDLQPDYGPAHAIRAAALAFGSYAAFSDDFMSMGREAFSEARRAVDLDGDNPDVLLAAGTAHFFLGLFKKSHGLLVRAVELNTNSAMACAMCGLLSAINGRPDDGIILIERAMRLSPRDPQTYLLYSWLGFCHFFAGRFDDAIQWCERSSQAKPRYCESWVTMAAAFGELGRFDEAARALRKAHELIPRLSLAVYRRPRAEGTLWPKLIEGLQKAGMPAQ